MSENNKTTTTSGSHPHEQDQQQNTKNGEQRHQIVNDEEETPSDNSRSMGSADQQPKIGEQKNGADKDEGTPADNPLPMENSAADEPTAHHEQHVHQQDKPNIPQESKTNMDQQQQELEGLEEIRKSRPPLSISEQFDKFNRAEANGVASRVAPYYWRPIPPALKKLNGMNRYNVRPGWKSPPPSPSKDAKDGEL